MLLHHIMRIRSRYIIKFMISILVILALLLSALCQMDLDKALTQFRKANQIRGIQLEITKQGQIVYHANLGEKNEKNQPIDNNTVVRIASISKSFASVAFMQLVEQGKISLNTTLSEGLGFTVRNPYSPNIPITLEMVMSHQSSIVDCDPTYLGFLYLTRTAPNGQKIPNIRELLHRDGQYYDDCLFNNEPPGTHFEYSNFGYALIGTVVQRYSGIRFDKYQREFVLKHLTTNQTEVPTFAPWTLLNPSNLAVLYYGEKGKWRPQAEYYPNGTIPEPNFNGYSIGTNGLLFSPQAGLRTSVTHLNNYMFMLANKGVTKEGMRILNEKSVMEILKPRYQYHGAVGGAKVDFQNYGLGIYKTGYMPVDWIIQHEVLHGHAGEDCGVLSGAYFWKDYCFSYYFTGSMEGYVNNTGTLYEQERLDLHKIIDSFIKEQQQKVAISYK